MRYLLVLNLPIPLKFRLNKFRLNLALKLFWLSIFISIISLLLLYIFQVNSLTWQNYFLKDQEKKLAEIKKEKEMLEINFSRVNSLANLETYFQNQALEKAHQIKYIQISEASVVAGR